MSGNEDNETQLKQSLKAYFVEVIQGKHRDSAASEHPKPQPPPQVLEPLPQVIEPLPQVTEALPQVTEPLPARERVTFDAKGNPVWKFQVQSEILDIGDPTMDLLESLETATIAIDEDDVWSDHSGIDPYNTSED